MLVFCHNATVFGYNIQYTQYKSLALDQQTDKQNCHINIAASY